MISTRQKLGFEKLQSLSFQTHFCWIFLFSFTSLNHNAASLSFKTKTKANLDELVVPCDGDTLLALLSLLVAVAAAQQLLLLCAGLLDQIVRDVGQQWIGA